MKCICHQMRHAELRRKFRGRLLIADDGSYSATNMIVGHRMRFLSKSAARCITFQDEVIHLEHLHTWYETLLGYILTYPSSDVIQLLSNIVARSQYRACRYAEEELLDLAKVKGGKQ